MNLPLLCFYSLVSPFWYAWWLLIKCQTLYIKTLETQVFTSSREGSPCSPISSLSGANSLILIRHSGDSRLGCSFAKAPFTPLFILVLRDESLRCLFCHTLLHFQIVPKF